MFKTISKGVALFAAIAALSACDSGNSQPQQGKQYEVLPVSLQEYNLAPLTEAFALTCGHCRSMEEFVPQIESLTEQKVEKMHVTFNESAQISAIIFYTAVMQLDATPDTAFMADLFAAVQMGADATAEERQQAVEKAFESRNLISPYHLDEAQQEKLFEYITKAESITTRGQINSVPAFIVNGKYQVITGGHDSVEAMAETINYLLKQPK
ncbi:thiol:disulfide interchange protein DsbA/DsbL [Vibrio parahaemolyticus]|uniref:thiol:disulfide interchange protein DsbA/DsbL n=1 Tax=Vibrio parahaemolyticus TaxID=670 RepID=UPI001123B665|nr:thiol:disulfide interchange protein DsbA/DsbL [Vibrio parahaemolyticus]TOL34996.1 thiol-disulfide isomerase [Vibrio parahaemolyticus]TOL51073.1 thiol-disulfide isomerase [Vibrio parahaemolyticus]HBC3494284.1 thiol:disulfide interchange protein DsbA/DsbL [Vibrio parahaemolyticus]HCE2150623.1 thiol:disulfide interchange protein DsbA/DsbL [Vibrio parahaemolyticus]HCE2155289.1 thiol:disulfide interchange protein DsbA/DsbL [Vibrio parahaemolyticus]